MEGLEVLLNFDGEIIVMDNARWWVKFEAHEVESTHGRPHGIKYSLTLHDSKDRNKRVLGYDNSHKYKPKAFKYVAKKTAWDHIHKKEVIRPYEFAGPLELMKDFWADTNRIMEGAR